MLLPKTRGFRACLKILRGSLDAGTTHFDLPTRSTRLDERVTQVVFGLYAFKLFCVTIDIFDISKCIDHVLV